MLMATRGGRGEKAELGSFGWGPCPEQSYCNLVSCLMSDDMSLGLSFNLPLERTQDLGGRGGFMLRDGRGEKSHLQKGECK